MTYKFTKFYCDDSYDCPTYWHEIIEKNGYNRLLELGIWEGHSMYNFVSLGIRDVTCVDIWMNDYTKENFQHNKALMLEEFEDLTIDDRTEMSWTALTEMLAKNEPLFDLVYVDASHFAHNALLDGCLAFRLLRVGGCIIFDDYHLIRKNLGAPDLTPKEGVDAFEHVHRRFIEPALVNGYQKAWYKTMEEEKIG